MEYTDRNELAKIIAPEAGQDPPAGRDTLFSYDRDGKPDARRRARSWEPREDPHGLRRTRDAVEADDGPDRSDVVWREPAHDDHRVRHERQSPPRDPSGRRGRGHRLRHGGHPIRDRCRCCCVPHRLHRALGDFALTEHQQVVRSDLAPIVRGNLRGDLDCALESIDGILQVAFGYDLYLYLAASSPCERAVSDAVRDGLWLEPGASLPLWDDDEG
jgi:hypothetical protein